MSTAEATVLSPTQVGQNRKRRISRTKTVQEALRLRTVAEAREVVYTSCTGDEPRED